MGNKGGAVEHPTIQAMLARRSVRAYKDTMPSDEVVRTIVRAGQQAPFAAQLGSVLLSRKGKHPFKAPLLFTICVDIHRLETFMARRGWSVVANDLMLLLFGAQDAMLMAENMVMAGESLGLGSCFLGGAPYEADKIAEQYELPPRVFPLSQLAMGYPNEDLPPRPRFPLQFSLFEDRYPSFDEETVGRAMAAMDEGYLAQDYYRRLHAMIPLESGRPETFTYDTYSWTEHISRKWGQWYASPDALLDQLAKRGFRIPASGS
jgi:nitroreductase